jgi:hypothetical protein
VLASSRCELSLGLPEDLTPVSALIAADARDLRRFAFRASIFVDRRVLVGDTHRVGVDISGVVEVRPWAAEPDLSSEVEWEAAISLDYLNISRDYDAFGCLFGVMNYAGFRPVAPARGLTGRRQPCRSRHL